MGRLRHANKRQQKGTCACLRNCAPCSERAARHKHKRQHKHKHVRQCVSANAVQRERMGTQMLALAMCLRANVRQRERTCTLAQARSACFHDRESVRARGAMRKRKCSRQGSAQAPCASEHKRARQRALAHSSGAKLRTRTGVCSASFTCLTISTGASANSS